jgi:hypothetical protein
VVDDGSLNGQGTRVVARALRLALLGLVLAACGHESSTHQASPAKPACGDRLAKLQTFFEAAAADQEASPKHVGEGEAGASNGVDRSRLVEIEGRPGDASHSDYLVVGAHGADVARVDGTVVHVWDGGESRIEVFAMATGPSPRSLVVALGPDTPWRVVAEILGKLRTNEPGADYDHVDVAYRTAGAFAGRKPPIVAGASADRVDIPLVMDNLSKEVATSCPDVADKLTKLVSAGKLDAGFLRAFGAELPRCRCTVDFAQLEVMAWLVRAPLLTLVPVRSVATREPPPFTAKDDATWADLVKANGGRPLDLTLVPPLPPPPPPPRPKTKH